MQEKNVGQIVELASAYWGSATLFAALSVNLFGNIGEGVTAEELAKHCSASSRGIRLLADACVALGLLAKENGTYRNTQAGALSLVPGSPMDLGRAIRYNADVYPLWGRLAQFAQTGKPVERPEVHLGDDAARTRAFALSMRHRALGIGRAVVPMLGLKGGEKILDLAGGPGTYAELMCRAAPECTCTTVDLPAISAVAKELVAEAGLANRIECRAGDYHADEWGEEKYDVVTIFGALHQESPAAIRSILSRARKALRKGGRIFVLDMMTDETHANPPFSALFGLNMALSTENGWVFSSDELRVWLEESGFAQFAVAPVSPPMPHWLAQAVAV